MFDGNVLLARHSTSKMWSEQASNEKLEYRWPKYTFDKLLTAK